MLDYPQSDRSTHKATFSEFTKNSGQCQYLINSIKYYPHGYCLQAQTFGTIKESFTPIKTIMPTELDTANSVQAKSEVSYESYEKYRSRACEICVPIVLKFPVYVTPLVIEQSPICVDKKGH